MQRVRRFLLRFFSGLENEQTQRKPATDKDGLSVRKRAFDYFYQGLRPSELPDMGVPKTTIYRYHQSFKHQKRELRFRLLKQGLKDHPTWRKKIAARHGISEEELTEALKKSRSAAQLKRKLAYIKSARTKRE
jgi:hypothetical protein